MKLRRKTLLSMIMVMAIMTVAFVLLAQAIILDSVLHRERTEVERNLDRVEASVEVIESELMRAAADWAIWNDTYRFIQDGNEGYIDSNTYRGTCAGLRLNYFLFFNSSRELVYGIGYDCEKEVPKEITGPLVDAVLESIRDVPLDQPRDSVCGLIDTEDGIMVVSAHAVSDDELTDANGFLVMGRLINVVTARDISEMIMLQAMIYPTSGALTAGVDQASWASVVDNGTTLYVTVNDTTVSIYRAVHGIDGSVVGVIGVHASRDLYAQAMSFLRAITIGLVLVSIIFCAALLIITDRFTTRRLENLSRQVSDIGSNGITRKIEMDGADELTHLADELNRSMETVMNMSKALAESEKRYQAVVNDQVEFIFRMDQYGRIRFVNRAVMDFLGMDEATIVQKDLRDLVKSHQYEDFMESCRKALVTGEAVVTDHRYSWPGDPRERWVSWIIRSIPDGSGGLEYQCVGRDLTYQKDTENALAMANKKLKLLASITRHDITNKLTVAHGFVTLARTGTSDPRSQAHLSKADAALHSIEKYLDFTRDYQRMGMDEPAWIDLRRSIAEATAQSMGDIRIEVDVEDMEILADPLVEKVFYNLIENAQRHGGAVTEIRITSRVKDEGLLITFEDNGTGVPAEEKEMIFQAGYGKNTGYGLFLAKEIVDSSGMSIAETGEEEKGARFEILVPRGKFRPASGITSPSGPTA
jgi:PAS domain S-box-containing protein